MRAVSHDPILDKYVVEVQVLDQSDFYKFRVDLHYDDAGKISVDASTGFETEFINPCKGK